MELELRVRLSEKPVAPGCGQSRQAAQCRAAARMGPNQPESLALPPTSTVTVSALATCTSSPGRSWVSLISLPRVQPKARPGTELERF